MCTAIRYGTQYFGRTLDYEHAYDATVLLLPRRAPRQFRRARAREAHAALLGIGTLADDTPLFFDAINEHGLCMAGLNFPGCAVYTPSALLPPDTDAVAPFELIPWVLSQCGSVAQARALLTHTTLWSEPFSAALPLSPLHWMIADAKNSLVVEPTAYGLQLYDNPADVLTNSPELPYHLTHLSEYLSLSPAPPDNRFGVAGLAPYSRGMGAMGLPGDFSSSSRFVRAAFARANTCFDKEGGVSAFFHVMDTVAQPRGCVRLEGGALPRTLYTSCYDRATKRCCYTTYGHRGICAVTLRERDAEGKTLRCFPMAQSEQITLQNG